VAITEVTLYILWSKGPEVKSDASKLLNAALKNKKREPAAIQQNVEENTGISTQMQSNAGRPRKRMGRT
jgi:hypothetical protein